MSVEVIIEDTRWAAVGLDKMARRAVDTTLAHLDLDPAAWDVSVLACDDARIAVLNADFRNKGVPTNVLSWPSSERAASVPGTRPAPPQGDRELGDIALAFDTCQRQAAEARKSMEQHILHLVVHGVLHLLGYDHVSDEDGDLMESTETAILSTLGVPNPYI